MSIFLDSIMTDFLPFDSFFFTSFWSSSFSPYPLSIYMYPRVCLMYTLSPLSTTYPVTLSMNSCQATSTFISVLIFFLPNFSPIIKCQLNTSSRTFHWHHKVSESKTKVGASPKSRLTVISMSFTLQAVHFAGHFWGPGRSPRICLHSLVFLKNLQE